MSNDNDEDLSMWDEALDEQAEASAEGASKAEAVELEELTEDDAPITGRRKT